MFLGKDISKRGSIGDWLLRWFFLTTLVWSVGLTGIWDGSSLALYDRMKQWSNPFVDTHFNVLLMEGEREAFLAAPQKWIALMDRLNGFGAQLIVFMELPFKADSFFFQHAENNGQVVLGRHAMHAPDSYGLFELEPTPKEAAKLPFGIISPGPSRHGIHRSQHFRLPVFGMDQVPSVEAAAWVKKNDGTLNTFKDDTFLVNFSTRLDDLPRVSLQQALQGNIVQELVEGRTVMVAFREKRVELGVHTPITPHDSPMSPAEFHAFALNTLLSGEIIREGDPFSALAVSAIAALLALLSYHRLPDQWSFGVAIGGVILYLTLGWAILIFANYYIPLFEAISAHIFGLTVMLHRRRRLIREQIIRLLRRLSGRLQEGYVTQDFYESDEHWSQIVNLVSQMLHMQRIMFLERVPGDHRLKEVKSLNCSLDDIIEYRRDYERTPYSTAIEKNGPLRLSKPYLTPKEELGEEIQYLTPLLFGGEVLGFWGFSLSEKDGHDLPGLEKAVAEFGGQIAEMLHIRRNWKMQNARKSSGLSAWLGGEGGDAVLVADVQKSAVLLEERLSGMEEVFNGQDTGTILYNLFGNVLHVNRRMSQLSQALNISPFNMTAVDFIVSLTGMELQEGRDILRRVTLDQDNLFLPVSIKNQGNLAFVLHVRPLLRSEGAEDMNTDAPDTPFPVKGILIELTDVSHIRRFQELKELLVANVFNQLRNDLESVVLAVDMLIGMKLPPEQKAEIGDLLKGKVANTVQAIEKAHSKLEGETATSQNELFPVSPLDALNLAVRNLEGEQSKRRVGVELHLPRLISLTMAIPDRFNEVFEGILGALLLDAAEHTLVVVKGEEKDCKVVLEFSNSGFGIPEQRFLSYMNGDVEPTSPEFRNLRQALRHVEAWGGKAHATSATGEGLRVTIELQLFICQT